MKNIQKALTLVVLALSLLINLPTSVSGQSSPPLVNPNDQGIGMQGKLIQPPPSDAPTITLPSNGQVFTELPVIVTGLCTDGLFLRVFKNNVFGGSTVCDGGSYSVQIDLFPGQNQITARVYDNLDQSSPVSNIVTVTYAIDDPLIPGLPDDVSQRITLTSTFARKGADPGEELVWPITLSGGRPPYAISVNWGDGKEDLLSQDSASTFDIKHIYQNPGVYKVIIKGTDADGVSAFLQLVGIANGAVTVGTGAQGNDQPVVTRTRVLWQPALIMFPLVLAAFWLGKRYQLKRVRYRIKNRILPIDK
ncbi:hypothetical protein H0V99_02030 [Candidatus Saccharibacteria bacterium]|nr:hypothetical protein [Candidatus Saccharibacteria bacterium]